MNQISKQTYRKEQISIKSLMKDIFEILCWLMIKLVNFFRFAIFSIKLSYTFSGRKLVLVRTLSKIGNILKLSQFFSVLKISSNSRATFFVCQSWHQYFIDDDTGVRSCSRSSSYFLLAASCRSFFALFLLVSRE